jgi:CubicO group peptidase (beta-lactamase class C family)
MADIALQHAVQAVLDELVAHGDEVGLQAVVMKDGALVADIAGTRLLSAEQLAAAAAVAYTGRDQVMAMEISWSLGYSPYRPGGARSRSGSTFGMVGSNGSAAYADIDTGVAVALMRNRFSPDLTAIAGLDEIVAEAYPPPANAEDGNP